MKSKNSRLDSIKMIISSKEVGSQEELLKELTAEGFKLTQATLSRDLKQLKVAKAASMNGTPVRTHHLAVFSASVKVGYLVCAKHVVHIFGELCFKRSHDSELFADKNLGKKFYGTGKDHNLFLEVLNMSTLGEELRHVVYATSGLLREQLAGAGKDGGTNKYRHIRKS